MSGRLSPLETICMKCQNLFSVKNKKNISSIWSSAESAQRVVKGNFLCEELKVIKYTHWTSP